MSSTANEVFRRHRLTVEDYYRMAEAGILRRDARVELIDGDIIDMPPIGARHAGTVNQLMAALQRAAGDAAIVQVQNPVRLDRYSVPEPDIALLRPRDDFYKSAYPRPADVLLIIEVAEASLRYDREVKIPLYARHGLPEVWIVDLQNGRLTRYREPGEGGYGSVDVPDLGDLKVGTVAVALGDLLADS